MMFQAKVCVRNRNDFYGHCGEQGKSKSSFKRIDFYFYETPTPISFSRGALLRILNLQSTTGRYPREDA
jgi:hypothetical protein